jgi:hypothetical protein
VTSARYGLTVIVRDPSTHDSLCPPVPTPDDKLDPILAFLNGSGLSPDPGDPASASLKIEPDTIVNLTSLGMDEGECLACLVETLERGRKLGEERGERGEIASRRRGEDEGNGLEERRKEGAWRRRLGSICRDGSMYEKIAAKKMVPGGMDDLPCCWLLGNRLTRRTVLCFSGAEGEATWVKAFEKTGNGSRITGGISRMIVGTKEGGSFGRSRRLPFFPFLKVSVKTMTIYGVTALKKSFELITKRPSIQLPAILPLRIRRPLVR